MYPLFTEALLSAVVNVAMRMYTQKYRKSKKHEEKQNIESYLMTIGVIVTVAANMLQWGWLLGGTGGSRGIPKVQQKQGFVP